MNAELDLIISSLLYALPFELLFGYCIYDSFKNKRQISREVKQE